MSKHKFDHSFFCLRGLEDKFRATEDLLSTTDNARFQRWICTCNCDYRGAEAHLECRAPFTLHPVQLKWVWPIKLLNHCFIKLAFMWIALSVWPAQPLCFLCPRTSNHLDINPAWKSLEASCACATEAWTHIFNTVISNANVHLQCKCSSPA